MSLSEACPSKLLFGSPGESNQMSIREVEFVQPIWQVVESCFGKLLKVVFGKLLKTSSWQKRGFRGRNGRFRGRNGGFVAEIVFPWQKVVLKTSFSWHKCVLKSCLSLQTCVLNVYLPWRHSRSSLVIWSFELRV